MITPPPVQQKDRIQEPEPEPEKNTQQPVEQEPTQMNTQTDYQSNYIDRLRRPQRGYRRMMANM